MFHVKCVCYNIQQMTWKIKKDTDETDLYIPCHLLYIYTHIYAYAHMYIYMRAYIYVHIYRKMTDTDDIEI